MSADPRYLVDTHVLLWVLNDDPRLEARHRKCFEDGADISVSAITLLEVAIKKSLGKLRLDVDLLALLQTRNIPVMTLTGRHAARVEELPLLHRDPFDRVLVAQAQIEHMTLLTSDDNIRRYDVTLG